MRLKHIIKGLNRYNDKNLSRPLFESIVVVEVVEALKDWMKHNSNPGVLVGAMWHCLFLLVQDKQ